MPGIHIDFTEADYEKIPKPKRTWCRDVLQEALKAIEDYDKMVVDTSVSEREFIFKTVEGERRASGVTPAVAAKKLGLGLTASWEVAGEADPLDV